MRGQIHEAVVLVSSSASQDVGGSGPVGVGWMPNALAPNG